MGGRGAELVNCFTKKPNLNYYYYYYLGGGGGGGREAGGWSKGIFFHKESK